MARWGNIGNRGNVDDRRGLAPVVGGVSVIGIITLLTLNYLAGGNLNDALNLLSEMPVETQQVTTEFTGQDEYEVFVSTVLGSNNNLWVQEFKKIGKEYRDPKLVLFRQATESGCGVATSEVGPHYCPLDETIYLDETFFEELINRFGASGGDVAEAYVIAHEVGHHVQSQLGQLDSTQRADSIAVELQADCYAGMWANSIRSLEVLEAGEIKEAMDAAAAVGDDRIQSSVTGQVNPETWTHGSSDQRVNAFNEGYESGDLSRCQF